MTHVAAPGAGAAKSISLGWYVPVTRLRLPSRPLASQGSPNGLPAMARPWDGPARRAPSRPTARWSTIGRMSCPPLALVYLYDVSESLLVTRTCACAAAAASRAATAMEG